MLRLTLALTDKSEWVKVFDPRGGGLFVATPSPPEVGTDVRVDLSIASGGPRVILKGSVVFRRTEVDGRAPIGCAVGLAVSVAFAGWPQLNSITLLQFLRGYAC